MTEASNNASDSPPETISLVSVYKVRQAMIVLYDLLKERTSEQSISHHRLPSWREHVKFVLSKPYRHWYLIQMGETMVGACYLTHQNEIGIGLFKAYWGKGFGVTAVNTLITKDKPLKAIPGKRSGQFIAHINPKNEKSIRLFQKLGFSHISNTYRL